jgi:polyhydroxybutyrate depolymerase
VTVRVPAGYDPAVPAPLLIRLHGYGGSGDGSESYLSLGRVAAARGMLYAHPDGTADGDGSRFWNATDACCDFDRSGVDDAAYLAGVIARSRTGERRSSAHLRLRTRTAAS